MTPGILIAGIGNIFLGDDGFGCEVARRLTANRNLPPEVRVVDYGIRGFDLAYALIDRYELTILIDAMPGGQEPGTVYTIEPDLAEADAVSAIEPHGMNPMKVLQMVRSMGGDFGRVLVVGCEPLTLGGQEGYMGLSEPVENAVNEAIDVIETLIRRTDERFHESSYGGHGSSNVSHGAA
jgi:hydrogenase maturation protease